MEIEAQKRRATRATQSIKKIFEEMETLGCARGSGRFHLDEIAFEWGSQNSHRKGENKMPRLTKENQTKLCRLIRKCTLLEAQGWLIATINRMGKVVAWHPCKDKFDGVKW